MNCDPDKLTTRKAPCYYAGVRPKDPFYLPRTGFCLLVSLFVCYLMCKGCSSLFERPTEELFREHSQPAGASRLPPTCRDIAVSQSGVVKIWPLGWIQPARHLHLACGTPTMNCALLSPSAHEGGSTAPTPAPSTSYYALLSPSWLKGLGPTSRRQGCCCRLPRVLLPLGSREGSTG